MLGKGQHRHLGQLPLQGRKGFLLVGASPKGDPFLGEVPHGMYHLTEEGDKPSIIGTQPQKGLQLAERSGRLLLGNGGHQSGIGLDAFSAHNMVQGLDVMGRQRDGTSLVLASGHAPSTSGGPLSTSPDVHRTSSRQWSDRPGRWGPCATVDHASQAPWPSGKFLGNCKGRMASSCTCRGHTLSWKHSSAGPAVRQQLANIHSVDPVCWTKLRLPEYRDTPWSSRGGRPPWSSPHSGHGSQRTTWHHRPSFSPELPGRPTENWMAR